MPSGKTPPQLEVSDASAARRSAPQSVKAVGPSETKHHVIFPCPIGENGWELPGRARDGSTGDAAIDFEPHVTPADRNSKNLLRRAAYWCIVVSWHTPKDAEAAQ